MVAAYLATVVVTLNAIKIVINTVNQSLHSTVKAASSLCHFDSKAHSETTILHSLISQISCLAEIELLFMFYILSAIKVGFRNLCFALLIMVYNYGTALLELNSQLGNIFQVLQVPG